LLASLPDFAFVIPLFPLAAFVAILALGRRAPGQGHWLGWIGVGASFVLSVATFLAVTTPESVVDRGLTWAVAGQTPITVGFRVDGLTCIMLLVVSTVALMVQVYSAGYMHGDPRYPRFFAYLSLFTAAMLGLVVANSILLLLICWELVGLSSYLLIGFWFERPSAMRAAKKAFVVTRLGDVGFLFGVVLLFWYTRTFHMESIFHQVGGELPLKVAGVAALLLFCGAIGKSAQFPLHVWLPDAMEGPTPVSALIHAATMVAAGVYLVARMYPLFWPEGYQPAVMGHLFGMGVTTPWVVATTGAVTLLMAAMIGVVQNDIKRVLAYSTVSQLGYMVMALGVGGLTAGVFHLFTHAFFKALLFLGAGSVIHGMGGEQDIMRMGGLRKHMPATFVTFIAGTLALAGIFPFSGFWSKDEVLADALHYHPAFYAVGLMGAFLTAFYMARLCFLTFWGEQRTHDVHPHESPRVMTWPLWVLATLAVVAGFAGTPWSPWFHHLVRPEEPAAAFHPTVALAGTAVAVAGLLCGAALYYWRIVSPASLIAVAPWLHRALKQKLYFDEMYWAGLVKPMFAVSGAASWVDRRIVDGTVNAVGWLTVAFSRVQRWVDTWIVDGLVNLVGQATKTAADGIRVWQTGRIQNYIMVIALGVVLLILIGAR
jgi:NADH-quinone oxidoreductase subunit L